MADKSQLLLVDALQRLMAEPAGLPVFASKSAPGLFPNNAAGKQAAQLTRQEGFVRVVRTETRGKATIDYCALSEKGLAFLLDQANPRETLEKFLQALEHHRQQLDELMTSARAGQNALEELASAARRFLDRPQELRRPDCNGHHAGDLASEVVKHLRTWHEAGKLGDCPLPELYRWLTANGSIGRFHDTLRKLHDEQRIYLHPWTGPLYEIPEPQLAMLCGHEVAYYASLRS